MSVEHHIHFDHHGHCLSAHGTAAQIEVAKEYITGHNVPKHDIKTGSCHPKAGHCQKWRGMKVCGESDDDITAMWGGPGHKVAHVVAHHGTHDYCMQVTSPKIGNNAEWRAQGDAWAKKHHTEIEDGPCGATWGEAVHQMDHGKTDIKIFMH